jgi:hypothetical protein
MLGELEEAVNDRFRNYPELRMAERDFGFIDPNQYLDSLKRQMDNDA